MNLPIETEDLGKRYGKVTAVKQLSLKVAEGEIYAFLGLNGAGKTTTIRMLLGMIKPTWGTAHVLQTRVRLGSRKPWAEVGYLVETPQSYQELTVYENLEVARRLHPGTSSKAVGNIIERMGLSAYADRRAGTLSQGNAQRLGLAKALLHQPKLLILDEPANGLDPAGIVEIRELLLELTREQGTTVFMASHILAEVSRLAQRIGIIHNGNLLQELDVNELEQNRRRRLLVRTRDLHGARLALAAAGHPAEFPQDSILEIKDSYSVDHPDNIVSLLVQAGFPPTHVVVEEEELEQYFLRLIGMDRRQNNE
ncbi:MAG TPA: ABC transporter ATP-binding protein [Ktedonobacteraceae bacterium]|nr:ABC transporter ATP-binding protein [Ktedonobacteraceae bacterium]